ncbi:hypothetical protein ACFU6I_16100 [Streptomyces sp. NPDC057486]|uniref:hypothetical protein n=1 Tax=Streptomyces sp. NPDC057486 TaxID=3346145 RepID=UPI0036AEFCAA
MGGGHVVPLAQMVALETGMQELHALLLQADTDEEHVPAPAAPPPVLSAAARNLQQCCLPRPSLLPPLLQQEQQREEPDQ